MREISGGAAEATRSAIGKSKNNSRLRRKSPRRRGVRRAATSRRLPVFVIGALIRVTVSRAAGIAFGVLFATAPSTAFGNDPLPLFTSSPEFEVASHAGVLSAEDHSRESIGGVIDQTEHRATLRYRTAVLDLDRFRALKESDSDATIALHLNLFGNAAFNLVSAQFAPTSAGYSLSGDLEGLPLGTVTLVVNGEVIIGSVHTAQETYTIRSVGKGGLVQIRQLKPGSAGFDEPEALLPDRQSAFKFKRGNGARAASGMDDDEETIVDLLVVWSPEAENEAGGRENMAATIDHLAAYADKTLADSGVRVRLNVPHMQKVDTEDDGGLNVWHALHGRGTALDHGNVREEVMRLRDSLGADLVHFVASGFPCAGIANIPTAVEGEESSFLSMSKYACASNVFVHEVGHNFGLYHERYLDARKPMKVAPYAHGYVNQAAFEPDAPASSAWRTVMAYGDQCSDLPHQCHWLSRFSNPDDEHLGNPLGVPGEVETHGIDGPADARRTMNEMRSAIAGYRDPRANLSVSATARKTTLDSGESFALQADIANRGRVEAAATTLVAYRSTDPVYSSDDEEAGRLTVGALDALSTVSRSLDLMSPADPGSYYYFACVEEAAAVDPCDVVHVTVGPTVSIADAQATEGQAIRFPVSMTTTFPVEVQVGYAVSRDTAVEGVDFVAAGGMLSIPAGETEAWIEVRTLDDSVAEPRDAIRVALSAGTPEAPEGPVVSADAGSAAGTIADDDGEFTIPDVELRGNVLRALGKDADEPITVDDMATLTELVVGGSDLTGLEFATGLLSLTIVSSPDRFASDLSSVGHLPALRFLHAISWPGEDLEPLRGLETLRTLDLRWGAVADLSPLAGLTELRHLVLDGAFWIDGCSERGDVSDLSPLSGLVKLRELHLRCNRVADLTPLSGMTGLRQLWVPGNALAGLAGLEYMPSLWLLALDGNPLTDLSPIRGLTELTWLTLTGASITDLSPLSGMTNMSILKLANNGGISNISALQSMRSCGNLDLSGNEISDLSPLQDLEAMRTLDLRQNRISELSPLSGLALSRLYLDGNLIEDVSPLSNIPLAWLSLRGNLIENIAPLGGIGSLTHLWLDGNAISDIGPLAKLTRLQRLSLGGNAITDVAPLADLAELAELDLSDNYVSDIAPLAGLPRLENLHLGNNQVADVSALAGESSLPALRTLYLYGNPLSEDSARTHLPRLRDQGISVYRAVALAMDASAKEGDDIEAVVRLTEAAEDPVNLAWGVLGAKFRRSLSVVDVEATASDDDFDRTGACSPQEACREVAIPAGTTEAVTFLHVLDDDRQEPHEVFAIELSGETRELPREVSLPHRRPGWLGVRISQAVGLIVDPTGPSYTAPLFPAAADGVRQGFMRIVNRGGRGAVHVEAIGPDGTSSPTTLSMRRGQTLHFNSNDLENGNFRKGLSRGTGVGPQDWRLRLWSNDIQALAYIRTADGFLTSMHDLVARGPDGTWRVPIFNPGSNTDQVSKLRLVNEGDTDANIEISGLDDHGNQGGAVRLSLAPGTSRTITAQDLETGQGLDGALGDGRGKWRLTIASDWPVAVANLLQSPTGHVTNLSTMPANQVVEEDGTTHHIPYFPSAADAWERQGFARVINRGPDEATVRIVAYDDSGPGYPDSLTVPGGAAAQFNSHDLEMGNPDKGLGGVGAGTGDWRLELESDAELDVLAYVRNRDGFLTSMHDVARGTADHLYEVPTFNPGSNADQVSSLLLANSSVEDASVTIFGVDDRGVRHGEVGLEVLAGRTVTVSARDLENGSETTAGRLGDGSGKWRLTVAADQPLWVMSLLESPTGHLTNLSTAPRRDVSP